MTTESANHVASLPDGLEDAYAKLVSMCGLLAHMAEAHSGGDKQLAGTFYSLTNLAESIRGEFRAVIEGNAGGERGGDIPEPPIIENILDDLKAVHERLAKLEAKKGVHRDPQGEEDRPPPYRWRQGRGPRNPERHEGEGVSEVRRQAFRAVRSR